MHETLKYLEMLDSDCAAEIRQALEQWRDMLSPVFCDGRLLDFDMAPKTLREEIEEVLR